MHNSKVRTRLEQKSDMRLQEVYEEAEVAGVTIPIPARVQVCGVALGVALGIALCAPDRKHVVRRETSPRWGGLAVGATRHSIG